MSQPVDTTGAAPATPAPSAEQQQVRDRAGHPTVLVAAAGSGKTRVLTWLYTDAHLQEHLRIDQLLAITFTNRAAGELRERIAHELRGTALGRDPDLTEAWIGTFHGICARLLREFAHHRGIDAGFSVIDELTAAELKAAAWEDALDRILGDAGHDGADLIAQVGEAALRGAVLGWWEAQRSAGEVHPQLPTPITGDEDVRAAVRGLRRASEELAAAVEEIRNPARPSKRLIETLETVEQIEREADAIEQLVARPPVRARDAARATAALELPKVPGGPPLGTDHPARVQFFAARELVARRLGELVAGPRVAIVAELVRCFSEAYERRKRADECLDHDDLELEALQLLREQPAVRERLTERFARVFVDEFQDTNPRQAQLVALLSGEAPEHAASEAGPAWLRSTPGDGRPAVTVVGDPRQAIYGFRYASVELIRGAAAAAPPGVSLELSTNYRSDAEVLGAIDRAWASFDPEHAPVRAHRGPDALPGGEPRVEVLITKEDRTDPWEGEQLGGHPGEESGGVLAEARLVAARIAELRAADPDRSVAVLARARRSLVPVAEALAVLGIDAVLDGAEGFWGRLEVADLISWLRLVRNPQDDAALIAVLASPLVALSTDGLALVGDLPRERSRDESGSAPSRLDALLAAVADGRLADDDARRVRAFAQLLEHQRRPGRADDPTALIDEVVAATGYDEHLAALQGGPRRLANLARLRRLAADEVAAGGDVTALVDRAASEQRHGLRAPEAALGGSGAVQLMTVHQSKGLEFDTVVVTGLGAQRPNSTPALLGDGGRLGLRLRAAPGAKALPLFDHAELSEELKARERAELRRVLYVALTRAKERLIVSGIGTWTQKHGSPFERDETPGSPVIDWLVPALVPEVVSLLPAAMASPVRSAAGIRVSVSTPGGTILPPELRNPRPAELPQHRPAGPAPGTLPADGPLRPLPAPPVLSYTALSRHASCGLRFYAEEVLRLEPTEPMLPILAAPAVVEPARRRRGAPGPDQLSLFGGGDPVAAVPAGPAADGATQDGSAGIAANVLGTIVHAVLEHAPSVDPGEDAVARAIAREAAAEYVTLTPADERRAHQLVRNALDAPAWRELWAEGAPSRERAFTIGLGSEGYALTGVVDAQVTTSSGEVLVVDYKTDRLEAGIDLATHVAGRYALQRAAYALAALRAGAERVRVVHLFLDGAAGRAAELRATRADAAALEADLLAAVRDVAAGEARATTQPDALTCDRCPARGRLCGWPTPVTLREPGAGPADPGQWCGDPEALRAG